MTWHRQSLPHCRWSTDRPRLIWSVGRTGDSQADLRRHKCRASFEFTLANPAFIAVLGNALADIDPGGLYQFSHTERADPHRAVR